MTQQTNGMPELKYSEETFRAMYEALKIILTVWVPGKPEGEILEHYDNVYHVSGNTLQICREALALAGGK